MQSRKIFVFIMVIVLTFSTAAYPRADRIEMRNLVQGFDYEISEPPSSYYPDEGNELTDGKFGSTDFFDPAWVGNLRGLTRSVVFDLGENKSVGSIKANFLEDGPVGIEFPHTVSYYVSMDGENWSTVAHIGSAYEPWTMSPARTQTYVWTGKENGAPGQKDADMVYARYVKVEFKIYAWAFIDEIEIWGVDGKDKKAVQLAPTEFGYMKPGENTGDVNNLMLLYNGWYENGKGDWTKEKIIPYISYVNKEGQPTDWLFDSILYLGLLTPEYRNFGSSYAPTNMSDWQWYMDKTFAENGDMSELNAAAKEVGEKLNQPDHKVKVVLMIPYPAETQGDFGDVDGDGISESFQHDKVGAEKAFENRKMAVKWYMDTLLKKWNEGGYSNLELSGLYWLSEGVGINNPFEEKLIQDTSKFIHQKDLKFYWIPWYYGTRNANWKELGFDAAAIQPNHFFYETDVSRIQDAAYQARQFGMGVEIEFDERANTGEGDFRQRYFDYLNGGVDYGYMKDCFKAYYQGNDALLQAALSQDPEVRKNYDAMYQFVKGTYGK